MGIPYYQQYFVEKQLNLRYEFLTMMVTMLLPLIHGILFLWVPWCLRSRRDAVSLKYRPYFTFIKYFDTFTRVFRIKLYRKTFYIQPSLLVVWAIHMGACGALIMAEIDKIDYQPRIYVVGKRIGRICIGNLPMVLLFVAKNNVISALSGLSLDKSVFFHKWLGRFMFLLAIIHLVLCAKYWLDMNFQVMLKIPPQIFGFIAFSCLGMLNVASLKLFRNFAFDLFLVQHRVFNFVMLLMVFFHNHGNRAAVILAVHLLVLDRITSRVLGIVHKRRGPTKGLSEFEVLDDTTIRISIPVEIMKSDNHKWWWLIVPRYGNWRAGQHVHLNVMKVSLFQYHPFTISSLADSGKMVIVLKVHKGFTHKLKLKLTKLKEKRDLELVHSDHCSIEELSDLSTHSASSSRGLIKKGVEVETFTAPIQDFKEVLDSFSKPEILTMKAGINGPYGGDYQPLTRFEAVVFFSAGSGASFTLPVALDLLKVIEAREAANDYLYRPEHTSVTIVVVMKKLANLQWYDHIWNEFLPFLNSGRAHLAVHITQEVPDASTEHHLINRDEQEKEAIHLTEVSSAKRTQSFNSSYSTAFSLETPGFSITYSRPDIQTIISDGVKLVCSSDYRKAFACLGCGPELFNGQIKTTCQKNRWVSGAPDIYCYTESFG